MEGGAGKVSTSYRHLKGEWDAGADLDTEAGRSAEPSRNLALEAKGAETQRRSSAEWGKERHSPGEQEKRKSPSDPRRPIKLKMIPRNVTVGRGASLPMGGPMTAARSPSVPCAPLPACTRATHTAVVHSSGGHTLLRGTTAFQQAPTSFASVALRYGRRCSSPQTPQLTGCAPCTAAPRSAQTSPSGPRSPRLTSSSSDPWSALISKNMRTQSIGAAVPPGEMDWLPAPSPCSRKSSWSSVSTDNDSAPCWFDDPHSRHGRR
ncbi:uncharacterized protein LOC123507694 [Portunus trituberculatus]|uniref:uncharacterized protein LOC123507694 n=1 Tax=Portunus trituberculatus TaxID=210409 RepID=UPI001E1CCF63|nr:uncharacterized protein LOC123507694 [Portunus trituberculatus]